MGNVIDMSKTTFTNYFGYNQLLVLNIRGNEQLGNIHIAYILVIGRPNDARPPT